MLSTTAFQKLKKKKNDVRSAFAAYVAPLLVICDRAVIQNKKRKAPEIMA